MPRMTECDSVSGSPDIVGAGKAPGIVASVPGAVAPGWALSMGCACGEVGGTVNGGAPTALRGANIVRLI